MHSVFLPFYTGLDLEAYSKRDRSSIIQFVAEYLLGCRRFSRIKRSLAEYECHNDFQRILKRLTPDYHKLYRRTLRNYVNGREAKIHDFDRYHIQSVDLSQYAIKRSKFPTEPEVMKSMSYTVNNVAFRLKRNRKVQRMTSVDITDIKQTVYMRILAAYRVYLPSVGEVLPLKAFYAVLHRALSSAIIDKIREFDTHKAQITVPFSLLGEEFESNVDGTLFNLGRYLPSPEDALVAKETFYGKVSHEDRIEFMASLA